MLIPRLLASEIDMASSEFPAVVLTGPRRSGKTFLLRHQFPDAQWLLLEDPDTIARATADPRTFLHALGDRVILDEIQNAPALLPYIRTIVDQQPARRGRWLLTGSQDWSLMRGVSESMAGRAAVLRMQPLSIEECPAVESFTGGFPEVVVEGLGRHRWFESYLQTYIERDVRALLNVSNVALFRRFLGVLVTRLGQLLNRSEIAAALGVSVPTVGSWIDAMEASGLLLLVPPWFENYGKRLLKSPRLYLSDPGLAAHLLGFEDRDQLARSPFAGALWECFVASELVKHRINRGRAPGLYWFRDQQGLEVDFLLEGPGREPVLLEAKATATPMPRDATSLVKLRRLLPAASGDDLVVHGDAGRELDGMRLGANVRAVSVAEMHAELTRRGL